MTATGAEPNRECSLCPRLAGFRVENRKKFPDWHNAPVPSFGPSDARLLVVGLAPGLKGANRTSRPFTGDYAGDLLYPTLVEFGFATGEYAARIDDGLTLKDCMITNAVRCVPPQNKPTGGEIRTCRPFLINQFAALPNLEVLLCLGRIAHESTIASFGEKQKNHPFGHGARTQIETEDRTLTVFDSYHCSRYNTNTGRLTEEMFHDVFRAIRETLAP